MEAILRNVPQDVSEDSLMNELTPFMTKLGIKDWTSEKPRRRTIAWVRFLDPSDCKKFLAKHEQVKATKYEGTPKDTPQNFENRNIARLHILKEPIFVSRGTRPLDKHTISHLELKHDKQVVAEQKVAEQGEEPPTKPIPLTRIICGQTIFDDVDNTVSFIERCAIPKLTSASAKFGKSAFTITIKTSRLDFYNNTIHELVVSEEDKCLTLVVTEPPRMYVQESISEATRWIRARNIPFWDSHASYVETCMAYRIYLRSNRVFPHIVRLLKSRKSLVWTKRPFPLKPSHLFPDDKYLFESFSKVLLAERTLPFALIFQVEALVQNGYLRPHQGRDLLNIMDHVAADSTRKKVAFPVTTQAMRQLFQKIPACVSPGTDFSSPDMVELMSEVIKAEYAARADNPRRDRIYGAIISDHQVWVFKVIVTPTRMLFSGPEAGSKNRVLRLFPNHNDYFLRVSFLDEDGQDLSFKPQVSNEEIFNRYRNVLKHGITIAGRRFSFLGFSHSSLRARSVWFAAPFLDKRDKKVTRDSILSLLGDFKDIRTPAKCAARIGQAFSETPHSVPLAQCDIKIHHIPDVKVGSRVFSDGVGTISYEALEEIWGFLPLQAGAPTCLQIRLAGYKGMLSLDPQLSGKIICLRKESMMKFPSNDMSELGICDMSSRPLQLMLNRPMIKILEDMGTKKSWFHTMQHKALNVLRTVTANTTNTKSFLQRQAIGSNISFPGFLLHLERMDIEYHGDSFLKSVVEHVVLRELRLLKHKARIPVDQGVTLFGIMDETGFLGEGQVYVTYDKTWKGNQKRVDGSLKDGRVIVTRSPTLHPGDVRVVNMVTPPRGHPLLKLQNCIVFSQKGHRDLPSQLSGGDLDGDLYNIIWDQGAMPTKMFSPADYPRVSPKELNRPVTTDDIADFFISFMKTDLLGVIATRHVILADMMEEGSVDENCVNLAELHSTAVDFSKTGIPVEFSQLPKPPKLRPDFLSTAPQVKLADAGQIEHIEDSDDDDDAFAGAKHKYYRSEKILGELYRGIDEKRIWHQNINRPRTSSGPSVWDRLLTMVKARLGQYELDISWERKSEEAWKIREQYETSIAGLMMDFAETPNTQLTEVEVFCGFILNKRGWQTQRQRDSSIKLKEEIDRVTAWMIKLMRQRGNGDDETASHSSNIAQGREVVIELCWACVAVGCVQDPRIKRLRHGAGKLQSFRVVAACCLVKELNMLAKSMEYMSAGGGFVGVGGGRRGRLITLPRR